DVSQPHIIEFDLRAEAWNSRSGTNNSDFTSTSDSISIITRRSTGAGVDGNATFWIKAQASSDSSAPLALRDRWNFFNGNPTSNGDTAGAFTNAALPAFAAGRWYHFKIITDPT